MSIPRLVSFRECASDSSLFGFEKAPSSSREYVDSMLGLYEEVFTELDDLTVSITTFNVACKKPLQSIKELVQHKDKVTDKPTDVIAFAFQEVDMSFTAAFKEETGAGETWMNACYEAVGGNNLPTSKSSSLYFALPSKQLMGLLVCVFVRRPLMPFVKEFQLASFATGMLSAVGNKGAVGVRLVIHRSSICILSVHLAAGQNAVLRRNASVEAILNGMDFNAIRRAEYEQLQRNEKSLVPVLALPPILLREQDIVLVAGDLNYRLNLTYKESLSLVLSKRYGELLLHDQLIQEMKNLHTPWWGFEDLTPIFPPTYRFDIGTNTYDTSEKQRIPGYTDRFCLYLKEPALRKHCSVDSMEAIMEMKISDHKPIVAVLRVPVRKEIPSEREKVEATLRQQFESLKGGLPKPKIVVSASQLDFNELQSYQDPSSQTIKISNVGDIAASVLIVRLRQSEDFTCGSWIHVSRTSLTVLPGMSKEVTLYASIDALSNSWLKSWHPYCGKGSLQLSSLIGVVLTGNQMHTVECKALLLPSIFYNLLSHIQTFRNMSCMEAYAQKGDFAVEKKHLVTQIPKELWQMGDVLYRRPQEYGIFVHAPARSLALEFMKHLDRSTERSLSDFSPIVVGHCLMTFLRQLLDPVIPDMCYREAIESAKRKGKSPTRVIETMPAVHANVFIYVTSLLHFLLLPYNARCNGLTVEIVADMFSSIFFRSPVYSNVAERKKVSPVASPESKIAEPLNQADREKLEDEQDLAKTFLKFFLTKASPAV